MESGATAICPTMLSLFIVSQEAKKGPEMQNRKSTSTDSVMQEDLLREIDKVIREALKRGSQKNKEDRQRSKRQTTTQKLTQQ